MNKIFLLIDLSYCIFHRYYATMRWYKFAHKEDNYPDDYNWFDNEIFKNMFEKKFKENFKNIIKKNKINEKNIFYIRDCPRTEIWRMKYYDKYKCNREKTDKTFKGGPFFKYTYNKI